MFATFRRSHQIFTESLAVLKQDREILVFPLLSGVLTLAAVAVMAFVGYSTGFFEVMKSGADKSLQTNLLGYAYTFAWYFVTWFIILYFNVAVIHCASIRLKGGDPTVADGFHAARQHLGRIVQWALISATVGLVLHAIAERSRILGRIVVWLMGTAWSIATFFIVPVMIFEKRSIKESIAHSTQLINKTWGEALLGSVGVGLYVFMLGLLGLLIPVLGFLISPIASMVGLGLLALYWLALAVIGSALSGIYRASLYLYATTGKLVPAFSKDLISSAFIVAPAKKS